MSASIISAFLCFFARSLSISGEMSTAMSLVVGVSVFAFWKRSNVRPVPAPKSMTDLSVRSPARRVIILFSKEFRKAALSSYFEAY